METPSSGQYLLIDLLEPSHPTAHDKLERRLWITGYNLKVLLAHHPPVGHHDGPTNLEPLAQRLYDPSKCMDVHGVVRRCLPVNGPALGTHRHGDEHLGKLGSLIPAQSSPSWRAPAMRGTGSTENAQRWNGSTPGWMSLSGLSITSSAGVQR